MKNRRLSVPCLQALLKMNKRESFINYAAKGRRGAKNKKPAEAGF
jgi:hypothetical protein